ncbi:MAG: hypothetical protein CM1200mP22_24690 [Dehalococcoidia bacterium]|nr:MAG: hypothetical protein CM1200mP22_24690 [Dehalococcoidia bacterium]
MVVYDFTEYQITLWARGNQFAVHQKRPSLTLMVDLQYRLDNRSHCG